MESPMRFNRKLALFIPFIKTEWLDKAKIKKVFEDQQIGQVENIILIQNKNIAFIHFYQWYKNDFSLNIQAKIKDGISTYKLAYGDDDGSEWYLIKYNNIQVDICDECQQIKEFKYCGKCKTEKYCSQICQIKAWNNSHRRRCCSDEKDSYKLLIKESEERIMKRVNELIAEAGRQAGAESGAEAETDYFADALSVPLIEPELAYTNYISEYLTSQEDCEGCRLLMSGEGGENQLGHSCMYPQ